jgi:phosphate:Na+ symporter
VEPWRDLALHILLDSLTLAENAPDVRALLAAITGEPVLCVALAALLTWAAHSSAAVVLFATSLAYSHFMMPVAALAFVLGANSGAAVNAILESGTATQSGESPASRRQHDQSDGRCCGGPRASTNRMAAAPWRSSRSP